MPALFNITGSLGCDRAVGCCKSEGPFYHEALPRTVSSLTTIFKVKIKCGLRWMLGSFILSCSIHPRFFPCHHETHKELAPATGNVFDSQNQERCKVWIFFKWCNIFLWDRKYWEQVFLTYYSVVPIDSTEDFTKVWNSLLYHPWHIFNIRKMIRGISDV